MRPERITAGLATATIYEIVNRGLWTAYVVAWREEGKRKRKQFADLNEAREFARRTVETLKTGDSQMVLVPRGTLRKLQSLEQKLGGKTTLEQLVEDFLQARRAKFTSVPVPDAVDQFLKKHKSDLDESETNTIKALHTACAALTIDKILPEDLETILKQLDAKVKRGFFLAAVKRFFDWAKNNHFLADEATAVDIILDKEPKRPSRLLTPQELQGILDHIPKEHPAATLWVLLQSLAGIRPVKIQKLRWEDVNLKARTITVPASDRDPEIQVKIPAGLLEVLREAKSLGLGLRPTDLLLPDTSVQRYVSYAATDARVEWENNILVRSFLAYRSALNGRASEYDWVPKKELAEEWFRVHSPSFIKT